MKKNWPKMTKIIPPPPCTTLCLCGVGSAEFSGLSVNSDSSSSLSSSVWFAVHNDIVMTHNLIMTSCQRIKYPLMLRQSMMNFPKKIKDAFFEILFRCSVCLNIEFPIIISKNPFTQPASHSYFNSFSVVIIRIRYVASCLLNTTFKTQILKAFNFFRMAWSWSNIDYTGILLFQI